MLTGDNQTIASKIAQEIGIDSYQAELLPEDKLESLETLINQSHGKYKIAVVGDGINDAPMIARADVGIAMGGLGSDAAIETADIVIMTDAPSKVPEAIKIAKKTNQIVWQNIIFALVVKGLFIIFGGFGVANLWEAVFADVGVALISIFNATRIVR
jgi:Cd2+/Zn2+-exporting ATPase